MFLMPVGDDVDHRDFPVSGTLLITANVMIFLYMLRLAAGPEGATAIEDFFFTWGLVPADLAQGQLVGVISHMFLHGGIMHLVGNMICLWAFVHGLERTLGSVAFIVLFVVWGIVGGLAHAGMNWGEEIPLVGASGAIAGMIGAYWVAFGPFTKIRTVTLVFTHVIKANVPTGVYVTFWIFMQLWGASGTDEASGGVAWYAHLGGFAAGALTMAVLRNQTKAQLMITKHGDMYLDDRPDLVDGPLEPQYEEAPAECPHCGAELAEANYMAENLLRCPNSNCGRCIYLEELAVA
jgi:membrane associated rhomboid family serine protease